MTANPTDTPSDRTTVNIGGSVSGQFTVGDHNTVSNIVSGNASVAVTADDIASLRAEFGRLRDQLPSEGPLAEQARENLDDLEEAITAAEPDVSTMYSIRNWFSRKLPQFTGAVTTLIVNPIVAQLVAAAGGALVGQFQQQFGTELNS
ncbi:hypothetical protein [Nocardia sp. NPDC004860]|uniref:hypothetical protein n=1 Tax=Nocardia sp. NPDC004860 TaxID=3154557 RepID=UPI0033AD4F17